jgi:hypothetical protein
VGKINKIKELNRIYDGIVADQLSEKAREFRKEQDTLKSDLTKMHIERWTNFKKRRLEAFTIYIRL